MAHLPPLDNSGRAALLRGFPAQPPATPRPRLARILCVIDATMLSLEEALVPRGGVADPSKPRPTAGASGAHGGVGTMLKRLWSAWINRRSHRRHREILERLRDFTMLPEDRYVANLQLLERFPVVPGCVVECGVWRGGMIAGMAAILGADRDYFLFDSFEGLPPARAIDGAAALAWQSNRDGVNYYDNCRAQPEHAKRAMELAGAKRSNLVKGWFSDTVPGFVPPSQISVLRLDGDWYESTMTCLTGLAPHLAPGAVILIDDYYDWDGCSRAVHDFLAQHPSALRVRQFNNTVCWIRWE